MEEFEDAKVFVVFSPRGFLNQVDVKAYRDEARAEKAVNKHQDGQNKKAWINTPEEMREDLLNYFEESLNPNSYFIGNYVPAWGDKDA